MQDDKHRIIEDPEWGFRRLEPIPNWEEVSQFYEKDYYNWALTAGDAQTDEELAWLTSTLYADCLDVLNRERGTNPKCLVDVGCGLGDFLAYAKRHGWYVVGLEPGPEAAAACASKGLEVYSLSIDEFLVQHPCYRSFFSVASFLNVLEHVPNPVELLTQAEKLLVEEGLVLIQVPNDFSEIQASAQKAINKKPWWVAVPDHINYFDFKSLQALLKRLGFQVRDVRGDFPMELFLLMGDDYVDNPEIGSRCHGKRRRLELSIPADLRQRIYQALAGVGVGRSCIVVGKHGGSESVDKQSPAVRAFQGPHIAQAGPPTLRESALPR